MALNLASEASARGDARVGRVVVLRDLELGVAGAALVLDLLDEIESLRARLRRAGHD